MNTIQEFEKRFSLSQDRLVGEGGFGKVYLSYDKHLDLEVAIKKSDVKTDERYNLYTEFKRISQLPAHANIANYIACFRIKESSLTQTDFAVLQYYPLGNLKQLIQSNKLNYDQKLDLIKGILQGLKFLHDNNIIHRDIKPPNILIAKRKYDEIFIPKITDFGISRIVNEFNEKSSIRTEFKMGQNEFTAPELSINKVPNLRPNADLYSAGMLIYFILTEKMPFNLAQYDTPERREAELYQLTHTQFDPNQSLEGFTKLPGEFQYLLKQLLKIDPNQRIKTAQEAIDLLPGSLEDKTEIEQDEETVISEAPQMLADEIVVEVEPPINRNTENEAWSFVKISNSISALKEFISKYPESQFADNAKELIDDLEQKAKKEDDDWNLALAKNKLDDYDSFINKYPDSDRAKDAKRKIYEISDEIAWKKAKESNVEKDFQKYLERFQQGNFVNHAKAAILILDGKKAFDSLKKEVISSHSTDKKKIQEILAKIKKFQEDFPDAAKELTDEVDTLKKSVNLNRQMFVAFDQLNLKSTAKEIENFEKQFPNHSFSSELNKLKEEIKENNAWIEAQRTNTIESYQNYLNEFPLGKYVTEATKKKKILQENQLWSEAIQNNSIDAYDNFIKTFPESKYAKVAKGRLENLIEEQEWEKAKRTQFYDDFKKRFPQSKYIDEINQIRQSKQEIELWQTAKRRDDIASYESYIKVGKNHLFEARERLTELVEERDWTVLHKAENRKIDDYYAFIKQHPSGKYVNIAKNKIEQIKKEASHAQILSLSNPIEIAEQCRNYLQYQKSPQIEEFYRQNDRKLWQYIDPKNQRRLYSKYLELYPEGQFKKEAEEKINQIVSAGKTKKKSTAIYAVLAIVVAGLGFVGYNFTQQSSDPVQQYKNVPNTHNLVEVMNAKAAENSDDPQLMNYKQILLDSLDNMSVEKFVETYQKSNEQVKNFVFVDYASQLEQEFMALKTDEFNFLMTWKIFPKCRDNFKKWELINANSKNRTMESWVTETEADIKKAAFVSITNAESALESFKTDFCNSFEDYKPTYQTTLEIAEYFNDNALKNDTQKILNACKK